MASFAIGAWPSCWPSRSGGLLGWGAPEMAPHTPRRSSRPGEPWRASTPTLVAPRRSRGAPRPPTLVAPRRSRGALRPRRSSRPGEAWRASTPNARRAPAKPWRASICRQSTSPSRITRRGRLHLTRSPSGVVSLRHFFRHVSRRFSPRSSTETSATSAPVERVKEDSRMDVKSMDRRYFLTITGIAGILAARQAPAFAQGSTRTGCAGWDFIPESDVEAQAPECRGGEGAGREDPVRDDQRQRPAAAHHGRRPVGLGRGHLQLPVQLAAPLPERRHRRERRRRRVVEGEGGFYEVWAPSCQVNGKWLSVPHSIVGNAVAYRKSVAQGSRGERVSEDLGRSSPGLRPR